MSGRKQNRQHIPLSVEALESRLTPSTTNFVQSLYQDVLHRSPGTAEVNYWANQLQSSSASQVVSAVVNSTESDADQVSSDYQTLLDRAPDAPGLQYFTNQMASGTSNSSVSTQILSSAEFQGEHSSNASFVNGLYQDVLQRPSDAAGDTYWQNLLSGGTTRTQVSQGFENSPEKLSQTVNSDYSDILGRSASSAEQSYWMGLLESGSSTNQIMDAFFLSPEHESQCGFLPGGSSTGSTSPTLNIGTSGAGSQNSSALTLPSTTEGTASANAVITVSGQNLSANASVIVTAPTGTEISLDGSTNFSSTQTLTADANGNLAPTQIFVRTSAAATTSVSDNLTVADSTDNVTQSVSVTGNVSTTPTLSVNLGNYGPGGQNSSALTLPPTAPGTAGPATSFTVSGGLLTANTAVSVTAPTGTEISLSKTSGFASTLTLNADANGDLADTPIYIRTSAAATTNVSGSLTVADSTDNLTQSVSVTGTVSTSTIPPQGSTTPLLNVLTYGPNSPSSSSLTLPSTTEGTAGANAALIVSGKNLSANTSVVVTAPTGTEISLNGSSGFASTQTLTTDAHGNLPPTPIFASISASATASVSGNLTIADSTDNLTKSVAVTGTVSTTATLSINTGNYGPGGQSSSSLTLPPTAAGTASPPAVFTVSGGLLTANASVVVTAPTGTEISLSNGSGFASTLTLTADANGNLASTKFYIRTSASATTTVSGTLTVTDSADNLTQSISVNGPVGNGPLPH